ncbi:MAG: Exoenzymes regulatory protein AepA precursor [Candidatus Ozemobacter sibiricus]|jgi:predicted amidohydrolase YtcJ|uniref:Exoenzymes regulatory protein AepA n=1 Tax=Candidatus Ozemobacter sibiricus TaxID=2268124 RepID=A0A367ZVK9_9BACT|nr:MAG: Exoenzymes regulatory protein AepA precursor [Candidatus Ozemobacter sibiricus]
MPLPSPCSWLFRRATLHLAGRPPARPGALLVQEGRIAWLGPDGEAPSPPPGAEVIDLHGGSLLPGFQDAHLHPFIGAVDLLECRLAPTDGPDRAPAVVAAWAAAHPAAAFIRGSGWGYGAFPPSGPHRRWLDAVVPDRPVFLKAIDGHSAWVNTAALRLAGITRETVAPAGGVIERDPVDGEPTGVLREWPAMLLVADRFPPPTFDEMLTAGRQFLERAARAGLTALHDAQGKDPHPELWLALEARDELTVRVTASRRLHQKKGAEQLEELLAAVGRWRSRLFRFTSAKVFIDGVVEGNTAFLLAPYADRPGYRGEPMWDSPDRLARLTAALGRAGLPIHVHAVGDGAVRFALDAIEAARALGAPAELRHQITHADLIDPADLPRFAALQVIANLQPAWFCRDRSYATITLPALGPERAGRLYPLASLLRHGTRVACSSDWPFSGDTVTFDPLEAIRTAVTRRAAGQPPGTELAPTEAVDLATMLDLYTLGSAYANQRETDTGSLEVGKLADLVAFDHDLTALPIDELPQARPLLTLLEGRPIWRAR